MNENKPNCSYTIFHSHFDAIVFPDMPEQVALHIKQEYSIQKPGSGNNKQACLKSVDQPNIFPKEPELSALTLRLILLETLINMLLMSLQRLHQLMDLKIKFEGKNHEHF